MGPVNNGKNSYYLGFNYYLGKVLYLFLILRQDGFCLRKHIRPCGVIITVMFVFGVSLDLKSFLIYFIVAMLLLCMIMQRHCCLVLENIWVIKEDLLILSTALCRTCLGLWLQVHGSCIGISFTVIITTSPMAVTYFDSFLVDYMLNNNFRRCSVLLVGWIFCHLLSSCFARLHSRWIWMVGPPVFGLESFPALFL